MMITFEGCVEKETKTQIVIASSSDEEINIIKGENEESLSKPKDQVDIKTDSLYKDCSDDEV